MSDRGMGAPEQKQNTAVYTKHTEIKMLAGGGLEVKTLDKKIRGTAKYEKRSRRVGSLAGKKR